MKPVITSTKGKVAPDGSSGRPKKPTASSKRASVACVSCKTRRTRCVKLDGHEVCVYCERHSLECVMTEDERKRSTSKAYLDSLRNRISLLEGLLQESGVEPPPMELPDSNTKNKQSNSPSPASPTRQLPRPGPMDIRSIVLKEEPLQIQEDSELSTSADETSTTWSLVNRESLSFVGSVETGSLPSLSSVDEPMDYGVRMLSDSLGYTDGHGFGSLRHGDVFDSIGKMENWGASLEKGEAWEGQAALMDMGYMLGFGKEEVCSIKGTEQTKVLDDDSLFVF